MTVPGETHVRTLDLADLERLAEIERESFPSPWSESSLRTELLRPDATGTSPADRHDGVPRLVGLGAEVGTVLLGFVLAWALESELHVARIAVAPSARRTGIARALMDRLLSRGSVLAVAHVVLEVREDNDPALALYGALGFVHAGARRDYYADGPARLDARVLVRRIGDG